MPKRVFWPIALVLFGIILLASNVGMMPKTLWNLWPLLFIIIGLGGLLISDKEEWDSEKTVSRKPVRKSSTVTKSKPKRSARAVTKKRK